MIIQSCVNHNFCVAWPPDWGEYGQEKFNQILELLYIFDPADLVTFSEDLWSMFQLFIKENVDAEMLEIVVFCKI